MPANNTVMIENCEDVALVGLVLFLVIRENRVEDPMRATHDAAAKGDNTVSNTGSECCLSEQLIHPEV